MSASSKKKLRKEQNAALLTEKQQTEQKEAKKLKIYSTVFIVIMLAVVLTAVTVMSVNGIKSSGIIQKNTVSAVVGEHELNTVEMNYYFGDVISAQYDDWYSKYGENTSLFMNLQGLDLSKPLNTQSFDSNGKTWADHFVEEALTAAKETYALYDKAVADNFTLSEDDEKSFEGSISEATMYATLYYGFKNLDDYLVAVYGYGANEASYREYKRVSAVAAAYYAAHADSLEYSSDDVKTHNEKDPAAYNSYTFNAYYVEVGSYLTGGTTGEDGAVTYSDAEKEAARAAAEKVANDLKAATSVVELDKMIAALEVNKDEENAASTPYVDSLCSSLPEDFQEWLSAEGRKENDITVLADRLLTEEGSDEEGEINGYYVVMYQSVDVNNEPLGNVRHLLVAFKDGDYDSQTGDTTYSEESKKAAKEKAEKLLAEWKAGAADEASFIELVKKNSDDSSKEEGGLFEDITPASNYVPSFLNWSIDPNRKTGDVEIIESEYGYHIMYYVGDDEYTYREYMIRNDLLAADMEEWYQGIVEPVTITEKNTSHMTLDRAVTG